MKFSLEQLADFTGCRIKGDTTVVIDSVAAIDEANEGHISFISNPKYIKSLEGCSASAVVLSQELAENFPGNSLISEDPYLTIAEIINLLYRQAAVTPFVHPNSNIAKDTKLAPDITIGPFVTIEEGVTIESGVQIGAGCYVGKNSSIGRNSLLHPNVNIYSDSKIGSDVIIHSGAVIGADGFGFALQKDKSWFKILQIGNVIIGDRVEVGANTCIDRAALGSTILHDGVKLDNLIQIGHNVVIGNDTAIAASAAVAGSTKIGKRCQIGGSTGISGHLQIADNVTITGKSFVIKSIRKAGIYSSGITADDNVKWRKNAVRFKQLDDLAKDVKDLKKKSRD